MLFIVAVKAPLSALVHYGGATNSTFLLFTKGQSRHCSSLKASRHEPRSLGDTNSRQVHVVA